MESKEKDPQMMLVQLLVHIPVWQKQELERLGINVSKLIREYLDQRLQKTKEIELAELKAEIEDEQNKLAAKLAMKKSIEQSLELKKEREKEEFLENNLDAFVLKKWLSDGKIPKTTPIFDFPDRDRFIEDINSGNISVSSELEEFKKYKFRIITKSDPDARERFRSMFSEFMDTGVMK